MKQLATTVYQPIRVLDDMDRVFNHLFDATSNKFTIRGFAADINETSDGYQILADLPGFTAKDVEVRMDEDLLIIEAKASGNSTENTVCYLKERFQGDRKRSFTLPRDVDKQSVEAEMKHGILIVNIKKLPEAKSHIVKVKG